jgi:hypothetical protein
MQRIKQRENPMKLLDALNYVLRRLGEQPVTGLDVEYPTVTIALPAIEEARIDLLMEEWYFNKFELRYLQPDSTGRVEVPEDVLQVYPTDPKYVGAGRFVRHAETGEHVDVPVQCTVILDIPFEELPKQAQNLIRMRAAYVVYVQDFGEDETSRSLEEEIGSAFTLLSAQHTRSRQYNTRHKRMWQRYARRLRN